MARAACLWARRVRWALPGWTVRSLCPKSGPTTPSAAGRLGFHRTAPWPPHRSWPSRWWAGPSPRACRRKGSPGTACRGLIGACGRGWKPTPHASGLAVTGPEYVWLGGQPRPVNTLLAALPEDGWTRLSAGAGAQGPRWDDWRWLPLAAPLEPGWRRWLLVRRRGSAPPELTAYGVFAPQAATREEVVRVAGSRWTSANGCEAATGAVGRDHDEVRSWTGW